MIALLLGLASAQHVVEWPLTDRWAPTPEAYFEGLHRDLLLDQLGGSGALDDLAYEVGDVRARLYVPESYEPDGTWGVFVYVYSDPRAPLRDTWIAELEEHKLIYVAPHDVGNDQETSLRIAWALDSLASVEAAYAVDPDRVIIGGFSGGAAIAVLMGVHYPDVFLGTFDQCRALMWEEHPIATVPGGVFGTGEISHVDPDGLPDIQSGHRFAFLSGDMDVIDSPDGRISNYEGLMDGIGDWWARDLRTRLFDLPGQPHAPVGAHAFGLAVDWILTCRDTGEFPPRFDTDHMPPHSPFPTPDVPPPDPCDPGDPGSQPSTPGDPSEPGCGCGSGGASWLWLAPLFLIRRRWR